MRLLKKFIYGALYLVFFALIALWVHQAFFVSPPSCFDNKQNQDEEGIDCGGKNFGCPPRELKSIKLDHTDPKLFSLSDSSTAIEVSFSNASKNYGLKSLNYSFDVYDPSGVKIRTSAGIVSISPEETKYAVNVVDIDRREIGEVDLNVGATDWTLKNLLPAPRPLTLSGIAVSSQNATPAITGVVNNPSSTQFNDIKIVGFAYDNAGTLVMASVTNVPIALPFSTTPFTIFLPAGSYAKVAAFFE